LVPGRASSRETGTCVVIDVPLVFRGRVSEPGRGYQNPVHQPIAVHVFERNYEVSVRGGARLWQIVKTGSSYASQSELPLTFGLGAAAGVEGVRVAWPSGRVDSIGALDANQTIAVQEGSGVVRRIPIGPKR